MKKTIWLALLICAALFLAAGAAFAESAPQEIVPMAVKEEDIDLENGSFGLEIEDTDRIEDSGYFTAVLFLEDRYDPAKIENLKAGDRVKVNGEWYTVSEVWIHQNDYDENEEAEQGYRWISYEIGPVEEFWGYIAFERTTDGDYIATVNDWNPVTLVKKVKIMLPLADAFVYHEMSSGGAEDSPCGADEFITYLTEPYYDEDEDEEPAVTTVWFSPYNTYAQFKDGLLTDIYSFSYPYGPEED